MWGRGGFLVRARFCAGWPMRGVKVQPYIVFKKKEYGYSIEAMVANLPMIAVGNSATAWYHMRLRPKWADRKYASR